MAKNENLAPENPQNELLGQEVSNIPEAETTSDGPAVPNEDESTGLVTYRVDAPRGIYLREGPGRAFLQLAVLPNGALLMGADLAGMLRPDRKPGDSAWVKVLTKDNGAGWVDSAFLERVC